MYIQIIRDLIIGLDLRVGSYFFMRLREFKVKNLKKLISQSDLKEKHIQNWKSENPYNWNLQTVLSTSGLVG